MTIIDKVKYFIKLQHPDLFWSSLVQTLCQVFFGMIKVLRFQELNKNYFAHLSL